MDPTLASPTSTLPSPDHRWTARLERAPGGHTLHLSGSFHAGWAGRLAAGLAARKVNIVRAEAHRAPSMVWEARFEIQAPGDGSGAERLDFLELVRARPEAAPGALDLTLRSYRVALGASSLSVQVVALDTVGFLDRLLRHFAFFGLFPCALRLDTRADRVEDAFRLQSLNHQAPRPAVVQALERRLSGLVQPPA